MKLEINASWLKDLMADIGRDSFSYEGCEALVDFYDTSDPDYTVDLTGLDCEWTEYGNDCKCSFYDLVNDYGYIYSKSEYSFDNDISEDEIDNGSYISELIDRINDRLFVLYVSNGNYIIHE